MYFLGVESTLHATKALVVDLESAEIVAHEIVPHVFVQGLTDGDVEQDPKMWIRALDQAVRACLDQVGSRKDDIVAMSVGAQEKGFVLLDEQNVILRPAKVSGDVAARKQLDQLNRAFGGPPGLGELLGNSLEVDSFACQLLWLKECDPDQFQKSKTIMQPLDFLNYWLTGAKNAEAGSASCSGLLDVRSGEWNSALVGFIDPNLEGMLLPLRCGSLVIGPVRPEVAQSWGLRREVYVSGGSGSSMMAALGSGSSHDKTAVVDLSRSGAVWGVSEKPLIDPRSEVSSWCDATHQWLAFYEEKLASRSLESIQGHYGWDEANFEKAAASSQVGAGSLKALPLGYGTLNAGGEGLFHGVTTENFTPSNMARAALEGVAVGLAYGYHRTIELGLEFDHVCVTGRGVESQLWRQIVSDVCGVPSYSLVHCEGAALGAAIHAAVAYFQHTGESLTFSETAAYIVTADSRSWCEPDAACHDFYLAQLSSQQYLAETLIGAGFLV